MQGPEPIASCCLQGLRSACAGGAAAATGRGSRAGGRIAVSSSAAAAACWTSGGRGRHGSLRIVLAALAALSTLSGLSAARAAAGWRPLAAAARRSPLCLGSLGSLSSGGNVTVVTAGGVLRVCIDLFAVRVDEVVDDGVVQDSSTATLANIAEVEVAEGDIR